MIAVDVIVVVVILALVAVAMSVRVIKQYERVVLFELGEVKGEARGPGVIFIVPFVGRVHRVSSRIITMPIQSQRIIIKDNVSIDVSAVAYHRVEAARSSTSRPRSRGSRPPSWSRATLHIPGAAGAHDRRARGLPGARDEGGRATPPPGRQPGFDQRRTGAPMTVTQSSTEVHMQDDSNASSTPTRTEPAEPAQHQSTFAEGESHPESHPEEEHVGAFGDVEETRPAGS
jgi:hypothetical protein